MANRFINNCTHGFKRKKKCSLCNKRDRDLFDERHPGRRLQLIHDYYRRNREKWLEYSARYAKEHAEQKRESSKRWYHNHPEYYIKNKTNLFAYINEWRKLNEGIKFIRIKGKYIGVERDFILLREITETQEVTNPRLSGFDTEIIYSKVHVENKLRKNRGNYWVPLVENRTLGIRIFKR